ncbi:MAG: hypothetical protein IJV09_07635 [Prevotella sp.]|nr:hypothetical protein [Prevotella sp.]
MIFFSLFSTAISSVFYGIIATAVVMTILFALLKAISKGIVQTPAFFVTGIILAVLLIVQFSLLIGAVQAKDATDSAGIYLTQLLENQNGTVTAQNSQQIMDAVTDHFPVIGSYLNLADFSGYDVSELPDVMYSTMIEYLNSYIWHRVWWILGFIIVACFIVALFENNKTTDRRVYRKRVTSQTDLKRRRRYKY